MLDEIVLAINHNRSYRLCVAETVVRTARLYVTIYFYIILFSILFFYVLFNIILFFLSEQNCLGFEADKNHFAKLPTFKKNDLSKSCKYESV